MRFTNITSETQLLLQPLQFVEMAVDMMDIDIDMGDIGEDDMKVEEFGNEVMVESMVSAHSTPGISSMC